VPNSEVNTEKEKGCVWVILKPLEGKAATFTEKSVTSSNAAVRREGDKSFLMDVNGEALLC